MDNTGRIGAGMDLGDGVAVRVLLQVVAEACGKNHAKRRLLMLLRLLILAIGK